MSLSPVDHAGSGTFASMCNIRLDAACYCQAYRDDVARGEPGVPGAGEGILSPKVVTAEGKRKKGGSKLSNWQ